jgi:hypothetical protein
MKNKNNNRKKYIKESKKYINELVNRNKYNNNVVLKVALVARMRNIILRTSYKATEPVHYYLLFNYYDIHESIVIIKQPKLAIHVKLFDKNLFVR